MCGPPHRAPQVPLGSIDTYLADKNQVKAKFACFVARLCVLHALSSNLAAVERKISLPKSKFFIFCKIFLSICDFQCWIKKCSTNNDLVSEKITLYFSLLGEGGVQTQKWNSAQQAVKKLFSIWVNIWAMDILTHTQK